MGRRALSRLHPVAAQRLGLTKLGFVILEEQTTGWRALSRLHPAAAQRLGDGSTDPRTAAAPHCMVSVCSTATSFVSFDPRTPLRP